jgi:hypothetical protein
MAELEGNVLRPPGFGPTVTFDPVEELLASTGHGYVQKGGTVQSGQGIIRVGEVMKRGGTGNKYWVKATGTNDASAAGFARNAVDATSENKLINVVLSGTINCNVQALNGGTPGAAKTNLNANTGLNGKYVDGFDYFIF